MEQETNNCKTIIVTGGSRGIGAEIVKQLAQKDYQVILNYYQSKEKAENLQKELQEAGKKIEIFKANVSKREEVKKLIEFTLEKFGKIDGLINNAGISQTNLFTDITDEEWNTIVQQNLTSVFYCTQEALPNMIHQKQGCIINISSIWGMTGASCEVAYSVTKAGIDGMTKALAKEVGPSGIRVNSIAPGIIDTDMCADYTVEEIAEIKSQIPLGKIGKPEDIAKCVLWLLEDNYTTGQVISPNGGWVI